jgi:hypothetical protein
MRSGWLVFAPVALLAWFAPPASADFQEGLQTTYYTIDAIPPIQSTDEYPVCGSEVENNINRSYDGEPYLDCTGDMFMVHMTGFINIPEHETIEFWLASDDGGEITIGENTFGVWQDQGCSVTLSGNLQLEAGVQPLELWMYENGGGTCVMLAWKIDDNYWEIVPDSAFTNQPSESTTTSTLETTTTEEPTTTSSYLPTTTAEPQIPSTTLGTTTSTSSTSTTLQLPSTTSTATPQYTTTTSIEPTIETTSTTLPLEETPDEELPTTTSEPTTTVQETSPTSTEPYTQDTSIVDTTVAEVPAPTPPDTIFDAPTGNEEGVFEAELAFEAVMDVLDDPTATDAELVDAVENLLQKEVTTDQAVEIISNPDVLAAVPVEVAQAIFEAIVPSELSDQQVLEITDAVQDASEEVREAFEETIDIFGEGFDTYEPVGSTISVAQRRAVVAVTAVLLAVPAPIPQRRRL